MKNKRNLLFLTLSLLIYILPIVYGFLYPIAYTIKGTQYNMVPMAVLKTASVFLSALLLCVQSAMAAGTPPLPCSWGVLNFVLTLLECAVLLFVFPRFGLPSLTLLIEMVAASIVILTITLRAGGRR